MILKFVVNTSAEVNTRNKTLSKVKTFAITEVFETMIDCRNATDDDNTTLASPTTITPPPPRTQPQQQQHQHQQQL